MGLFSHSVSECRKASSGPAQFNRIRTLNLAKSNLNRESIEVLTTHYYKFHK